MLPTKKSVDNAIGILIHQRNQALKQRDYYHSQRNQNRDLLQQISTQDPRTISQLSLECSNFRRKYMDLERLVSESGKQDYVVLLSHNYRLKEENDALQQGKSTMQKDLSNLHAQVVSMQNSRSHFQKTYNNVSKTNARLVAENSKLKESLVSFQKQLMEARREKEVMDSHYCYFENKLEESFDLILKHREIHEIMVQRDKELVTQHENQLIELNEQYEQIAQKTHLIMDRELDISHLNLQIENLNLQIENLESQIGQHQCITITPIAPLVEILRGVVDDEHNVQNDAQDEDQHKDNISADKKQKKRPRRRTTATTVPDDEDEFDINDNIEEVPVQSKKNKISLDKMFVELAEPNNVGVSRWVSVSEFVGDYNRLEITNGCSWGRKKGALCKKYNVEMDRTITPGTRIDRIRLNGFTK
jgi:hypothetical protein